MKPMDAARLEAIHISKRFGPLVALDKVDLRVEPGTVHALLGGNGAGKSTLVKCIMGFYKADRGAVVLDNHEVAIHNPRDAAAMGIGMVYQHFTLVGNMTVAENFVMSRGDVPFTIDWKKEKAELAEFIKTTPFKVDLNARVSTLSAGQKQKVEILKQLYLKCRVLILDEPTSVLTPQEADEVLTMVRNMATSGQLTVLVITHKFAQVLKYCDEFTVLRLGMLAGRGKVADFTAAQMAEMMVGKQIQSTPAQRAATADAGVPQLVLEKLSVENDTGRTVVHDVDLAVKSGEVVAVVGVSGNGQTELVQALCGQRRPSGGKLVVRGRDYRCTRGEIRFHKMFCLPEEPLRSACVGPMSVGANIALRSYDRSPLALGRSFVRTGQLKKMAQKLIESYRVKTPTVETPIQQLSGGNVQRAVLARELSGEVNVLVVQNPCFGLDFAATADIRSQIMASRNRGTAVLLVTEDLEEAFELADRIVVIYEGRLAYECPASAADLRTIGRYMAGHGDEPEPSFIADTIAAPATATTH